MDRAHLKRIAKRSRLAVVAVRIAGDRASKLRNRLRRPTKHMGATHMNFDLEASLDYVDLVYDDFLRYAEIAPTEIQGARVLELGPGDNFGIPLAFLGDGAAQVTTIDRFFAWRDDRQQVEIYNAMFSRMEGEARKRAEAALASTSPVEFDSGLLRVIEGTGVEGAAEMLEHESYDLIVSRAVLEHVANVVDSFSAMDALLRPGGVMAHKIDFRDHGLFTNGGHHPLTFLTVPDRVYLWMGANSGLPNRHLANWYRDEMKRRGYEARFFATHVVGQEAELLPHPAAVPAQQVEAARPLIDEIRPRLRPRFRDLSDQDLATAGVFLVARKPK